MSDDRPFTIGRYLQDQRTRKEKVHEEAVRAMGKAYREAYRKGWERWLNNSFSQEDTAESQ
jgi:hypothetical protein